jgi:hypothetical protein
LVRLAQIINKARGKSGPLFNFDVHDDVRMFADATIEKDEVRFFLVCFLDASIDISPLPPFFALVSLTRAR